MSKRRAGVVKPKMGVGWRRRKKTLPPPNAPHLPRNMPKNLSKRHGGFGTYGGN